MELHPQGYRGPDGMVRVLERGLLHDDHELAGKAHGRGERKGKAQDCLGGDLGYELVVTELI